MAFLHTPNVIISGISACVPKEIEENINYPLDKEELGKLISSIGVERKRIVDPNTCTSDLCFKAAEKLIEELKWNKEEINCLVFVSQSMDYVLPATSCILQNRLGLSNDCYTLDISLGCSGWVHGLSTIASLIFAGNGKQFRKAILLSGDTSSKSISKEDKSAWPLFGDAGSATAIEFKQGADGLKFHFGTDGDGANAIIIKDGGYRNCVSEESFINKTFEGGIIRNNLQLQLDGMDVFAFAISKAPQSVNNTIEYFNINKEAINYYIFHQANLFLNEKIRKKLKLDISKVPYSLKNFGNTSSASIPLTMVTELREKLINSDLLNIACGFGVGLSWATVAFNTKSIICPKIIEY